MKIVFINSHPISYFSDMYRYLSSELDIETWYCSRYGLKSHWDKEFNSYRKIEGLLDGFKYKFLLNLRMRSNGSERLLDTLNPFIFFNLLSLKKNDLVICHGWSRLTMVIILLFGKLFGLRVGIRAETPIIHEYNYIGLKKLLRRFYLKKLFKNIDYFFYIGTNNKLFYESLGVEDKKMIFLPYSINPLNLKFKKKEHLSKKIVFSGKLIDKKKPTDLLFAFSEIRKNNLKLYFAGEGELRKKMEELIEQLSLKKNVKLLGLLDKDELNKLYKDCDLLILPSGYGETWGLVINEALEFGLPIISSDMVGSSVDLCNKNGYIFEYSNTLDLKSKIEKFYNLSLNDIEKMRIQSYELKDKFSFNTILTNLNKLIKDEKQSLDKVLQKS